MTARPRPPVQEVPPHVRRLLRLLRGSPRLRAKAGSGRMLAEGPHLLAEALAAGLAVDLLVLTPRGRERLPASILSQATRQAREVLEVSEEALAALADTATPRGVLAVVRFPPGLDPAPGEGPWVALYRVRDPRNLGAIARSAWGAGAAGLCLVDGAGHTDAKALR